MRRQQLLALVRSKGTSVSEEVDRLEQARFARAIFADDARHPRIELQASRTDAAEILDIDRGQHIGDSPSEPHRHHHVLGLRRRAGADQAAAVRVGEAELHLAGVDGCQRVEEVVDVEADLDLFA